MMETVGLMCDDRLTIIFRWFRDVIGGGRMLRLADLAQRPDVRAGPLSVSPSRRLVEGPAGRANVEPIVMKVFLLLLDARGAVVTRDELFDQAWGGVIVGDDSLNRAIALVRKIGAETAPGLFEIETIPRTGYRLTGEIVDLLQKAQPADEAAQSSPVSRRTLIVGGAAIAATAATAGALWWTKHHNPRFDDLMARGDAAFRDGTAFEAGRVGSNNSPTMINLYQEAVRLDPRDARAWGLLAYFISAAREDIPSKDLPGVLVRAQNAIENALRLDSSEPNARVALFLLRGSMMAWASRDHYLRNILATNPNNIPAMLELMPLLQAAGLTRESWSWNERMLELSPFLRVSLTVKALKLWILGRLREADDVINRVISLWPDYRFGRYARFTIFALSGRPQAARADLDADSPAGGKTRRLVLDALEMQSRSAIETATAACVQTARVSPPLANDAIMYLCAMNKLDTAFELTEGFLLWRGKFVSENPVNRREADNYNRRMTQWLFTPPAAIMRADRRFLPLCAAFGLTDYWNARHIKPDYLVYG